MRLVEATLESVPVECSRPTRGMPRHLCADNRYDYPNQLIDVPPQRPARTSPLTIGWGGSPGHFADWYQLAPRLNASLDRRPGVHLAVQNAEFTREFLRLSPERYRFVPFGSLENFRFLDSLDIGLAPLLPQ